MSNQVLNLRYTLEEQAIPLALSEFKLIWKVEADDSYKVSNNGFREPVMFLTLGGCGIIMLKKKSGSLLYELHENQVLYLGTDEPCEYYCSQQANWKFYFIRYSNTAILDEFQFKREVVYSIANRQRAIHLCENMISQLVYRAPGCLYRVQASFFELISMIASEQQGMNAVVNPNIARVIEWMHRNIDKSIRIEQFVRQSRMSRNQFFLSFKDFTGMSPMDYFIKLKLDSAKLALESTTRTVRSIAESLHFCDAYYLSKLFKKHFGMSPAVYRNSVRKEE